MAEAGAGCGGGGAGIFALPDAYREGRADGVVCVLRLFAGDYLVDHAAVAGVGGGGVEEKGAMKMADPPRAGQPFRE